MNEQVATTRASVGPDRLTDVWGTRAPFGRGQPWPARTDQLLADGVEEADVDRWVRSRRGRIVAPLRITGIRQGAVFAPFHYGYWDAADGAEERHPTAANELTITEWDAVSKQPVFKTAAVRVARVEDVR